MSVWVVLVAWMGRLILLLLLGLSIWSVSVMIDRRRVFKRMVSVGHLQTFLAALRSGDRTALQRELTAAGNQHFPWVGLIQAFEQHAEHGAGVIEPLARAYLSERRIEMEKGLTILGTLGSNAPFIGLFGTVLGIIQAFAELARQVGGTEAVMAGISEALVATAVGLFVAIPAVVAYNYFSRLERDVLQSCEIAKNLYLARFSERGET